MEYKIVEYVATNTHDDEALAVSIERMGKIAGYDRLIDDVRELRDWADGNAPIPCGHVEFTIECACCWYVKIYRWTRDEL